MSVRLLLLGIVLVVIGCAQNQPSRGWVTGTETGEPYPDFIFVDEHGTRRSLRNFTGDFTVLAFTRCDDDTHGPAVDALKQLVDKHADAPFVRVVGVDVHWFKDQCDHQHCHLVQNEKNLMSICDATGAIRKLYGVDGDHAAIVIGPDGRVLNIAPSVENRAFQEDLKKRISAESERRARELSQEYEKMFLSQ